MIDVKAPEKPSATERDVARQKAQQLFSPHDERTALVKEMVAKENAASNEKTAKLRALRLAKEAAERQAMGERPVAHAKPAKRTPRRIKY